MAEERPPDAAGTADVFRSAGFGCTCPKSLNSVSRRNFDFVWFPYLVLVNKFELLIVWCLENRVNAAFLGLFWIAGAGLLSLDQGLFQGC